MNSCPLHQALKFPQTSRPLGFKTRSSSGFEPPKSLLRRLQLHVRHDADHHRRRRERQRQHIRNAENDGNANNDGNAGRRQEQERGGRFRKGRT